MSQFFHFILTIVVAYISGYIFQKIKVPAGGLVGSLLGVIILNLVFNAGFFYDGLKPFIQFLLGINVASSFKRSSFDALKHLGKSVALVILIALIYNTIVGALMLTLTPLDAATSLFASAPGGATDMAIISIDHDANASYVAIIQIFRVIAIVSTVPILARKLTSKITKTEISFEKKHSVTNSSKKPLIPNVPLKPNETKLTFILRSLGFYATCAVGGLVLLKLGMSAGMLVGGALLGGAYSMWQGGISFSPKIKLLVQVLAGTLIGCKVTRSSLQDIHILILPIIIICVITIIFTVLGAFLFHKITKIGWLESFFSVAPGGIMEMSVACEEVGGDVSIVATLQGLRMVFVIAVIPLIIPLFI